MVGPVSDRAAMIAGMNPTRRDGTYVFCTLTDEAMAKALLPRAIASFQENEGLSLILLSEVAAAHGLETTLPMACITLQVQSALNGVGLTAAVATALADAHIACNMVAGYHHDHVFVRLADADAALAILRARASSE